MPEASQVGPPELAPLVLRARSRRRVAPRQVLLLASGVLAAAGITVLVVAVNQPFVPQPVYSGMPKPCTMVPEPRQVIANGAEPPGGIVQVNGPHRTGICYWFGMTASGQPESLQLEVDLYGSAAGAETAYDSQAQTVSGDELPDGITQVTWTALGLGNQAIGQIWNGAPIASESTVSIFVQSGNADISLSYVSGWNRSASDSSEEGPVLAMARDILTALRVTRGAGSP